MADDPYARIAALEAEVAALRERETALAAQIVGLNSDAAQKWNDAKKKIDDKKYTEALDDLQALINVSGDDLIPLSTEHSVQIRWLCHRTIATLPPSVLRTDIIWTK